MAYAFNSQSPAACLLAACLNEPLQRTGSNGGDTECDAFNAVHSFDFDAFDFTDRAVVFPNPKTLTYQHQKAGEQARQLHPFI